MKKVIFCLAMVVASMVMASDWHREKLRSFREGSDAAFENEDLLATAALITLMVEAATEKAFEGQAAAGEQQEVADLLTSLRATLMATEDAAMSADERKRAERRLRLARARLKAAEAELEEAILKAEAAENEQAAEVLKRLLEEMTK